ncbi:hypothetical protein Kpol_1023p86 [Vanderwaltozyma polyspora DSM 70294]|uniref:Serine/threonine-protein phosphatase n=1 Tax=Vanderwaltozyma polyspora (strain ATCC 22028 / DSM 70294 / BCRC 21397 / CBS 2163 / NBRC 10782 / NRRL Y-8283 / UCD 57-17) TaxID=436907 RepID=A7TFV7_VANPO|nr:uncharacterized protein Kpol_1023p86 [Vanderwaltozyma polyspora DSM 70294]EDO18915.1 hypothetical protein Kpol_1023p86 [Vanderwaltozyma polyspora DSM 70294]
MGNSSSKPSKSKQKGNGVSSSASSINLETSSKIKSKNKKIRKKSQSSNDDINSSTNNSIPIKRIDTEQSTKSVRSKKSENGRDTPIGAIPTINVSDVSNDKELDSKQAGSRSNSQNLNHRRNHSLGHIPQMYSSNTANNSGNNLNSNNSSSTNMERPLSRRSSYNTNMDLPPSMVQMQPKSPILKNYKHSHSATSFTNNEHALTDDDDDDNNKHSKYNNNNETNLHSAHQRTSSRSRLEVMMNPASDGERSPSVISKHHKRSDSNLDVSDSSLYAHSMSRTGSHASSLASGNTTTYTTPLNSPGITKNGKENDDYFNPATSNLSETHIADSSNDISTRHGFSHDFHELLNSAKGAYLDAFPTVVPDDDDDLIGNKMNDKEDDSVSQLGGKKKKPLRPINIDETIQKLLDAGYAAKRTKYVCLKNSEIAQICQQAREIFLSQPPLLELSPPVKIVGDVHGQYGDLLRLFTKCGFPPAANYLFLGDYVDRGKQSLETILLLLCYKIKYPENFFLLRGNHECANVTRVYGFYDECKRRCNIKTWKVFIDTFNTLPLAAIVTGKIFCVHGGLSPVLNSMDEIRHVSRPTDVPDFGLINDLLWSDPTDSPNEWEDNERGVSYCYNKVAINKFLNKFGFDLVCRAHMVVEDGYEFFNDRSLVTVFSAPNYCGEFDNWGAVMSVSEGLLCSFELLDPLDSTALKQVMKRGRQERKLANQQQQLQ